ncbi:MAG: NAD-dependent DNA ligase LigA [bacterium]|nr:NAD-dependent DNA ligase LigA [bacterium]
MDKAAAKARIEQLKKVIHHHRYLYHVLDKQEISDEALDALKKELFDLETQFPEFVTADSPTQRVGGRPLKEFKKLRHEKPMLSFNDAFSEADMREWLTRLENYLGHKVSENDRTFYCELKIDGLAIELEYVDGVFVRGGTRGDGLVGEDVTQNIRTVEAIPLRLEGNPPKRLVVRGEVFLTKKEFARINKEQAASGEKIYANPRNFAAGSIRQLDPKVMAARKLDSFQYDIVSSYPLSYVEGFKTHEEEHAALKSFGFKTNPDNKRAGTLRDVFAIRNYWEKHRDGLLYEIDGIVVIVNDNKTFEDGAVIGKAPRAAMAYKFSPREATTVVERVIINVGRTGALTPVAEMRPVNVGGVTITHATLHNMDEIERLGLKIGDTVIVSRAGDVIPQVTKVLKEMRTGKEKAFTMPLICPVDGSKVIRDGVAHRCSNPYCGARLREGLYHFVSQNAFNIEGVGPKVIDRFLDEGLITDAADLFTLQKGDVEALERFGEKSAENIIEELQLRKKISLDRLIYSLGILHVGEETARALAQFIMNKLFPERVPIAIGTSRRATISGVLRFFLSLSLDQLQEVPDIGPKVAQSIYGWFHEPRNVKFVEKLAKAGVVIEHRTSVIGQQKFSGKTFVLTGTLQTMSREQAKEKIRAAGGDVNESVSKHTSYVVVGAEPGSKFAQAKKLGVPTLDEKGFLGMIK